VLRQGGYRESKGVLRFPPSRSQALYSWTVGENCGQWMYQLDGTEVSVPTPFTNTYGDPIGGCILVLLRTSSDSANVAESDC